MVMTKSANLKDLDVVKLNVNAVSLRQILESYLADGDDKNVRNGVDMSKCPFYSAVYKYLHQ